MKISPLDGLIQNRHGFDQEPWERWQHLDRKSDEYKAGSYYHLAPWVKHGTYYIFFLVDGKKLQYGSGFLIWKVDILGLLDTKKSCRFPMVRVQPTLLPVRILGVRR